MSISQLWDCAIVSQDVIIEENLVNGTWDLYIISYDCTWIYIYLKIKNLILRSMIQNCRCNTSALYIFDIYIHKKYLQLLALGSWSVGFHGWFLTLSLHFFIVLKFLTMSAYSFHFIKNIFKHSIFIDHNDHILVQFTWRFYQLISKTFKYELLLN